MVDDRDRQGRVVDRGPDAEAAVADGFVVRAARDEHDVVAVSGRGARRRHRRSRPRRRRRTASRGTSPEAVAEEREHAVERVRVGWPGLVDEVLGEHRVRGLLDAVRVARRRVDLDADEVVAELLACSAPSAASGTARSFAEPQAEHAQVVVARPGPSRARGRRRRGRARAARALPSGIGIEGWLSTGASRSSSTAIASAKPPREAHARPRRRPGRRPAAWRSRASARSHSITGDVRLQRPGRELAARCTHRADRLHDVRRAHRLVRARRTATASRR